MLTMTLLACVANGSPDAGAAKDSTTSPNNPRRLMQRPDRYLTTESFVKKATRYGTDKGKNVGYAQFYANAFQKYYRQQNAGLTILEIGVYKGASLLLWRNIFGPEARIFGLDPAIQESTFANDPFMLRKLRDANVTIFEGNADDIGTLWRVSQAIGEVDILIDDGSHMVTSILTSFEFFKSRVRCMYIIEDTTLTLDGKHFEIVNKDNVKFLADLQKGNKVSTLLQPRLIWDNFWANAVREMDAGRTRYNHIGFYHNLVVVDFGLSYIPGSCSSTKLQRSG